MSAQAAIVGKEKDYDSQFKEEIVAHLISMGGKVSGNNINSITCPSCGKAEAWTKAVDPTVIICNRKNNCGTNTHIKFIAPHLFANWAERFPSNPTDPNATARAYLRARGLDPTKFDFEQGTWSEQSHNITTVAFSCPWTSKRWHRLLDVPKGIDGKTRWDKAEGESYQGNAWATSEIDSSQPLWMVEGILEALSLQQGLGFQAATTFSAAHIPTKFYEQLDRSQEIIIALNADKAGQDGTHKNLEQLKKLGFKQIKVSQPPVGKDWNDLLCLGLFAEELREKTLADARWSGRLLQAKSPDEYFMILRERSKKPTQFFLWSGRTWIGSATTNKEGEDVIKVDRAADCELRLLFSLNDTTDKLRHKQVFLLETKSQREGIKQIRVSANELVQSTALSTTLLETARQVLKVSNAQYSEFADFLLKGNPPTIRQLETTGYDEDSNAFVFPKFAFDQEGQLHQPNAHGYYEKLRLMPKEDTNAIKCLPSNNYAIPQILEDHWNAFGVNGALSLGFQVTSLFLHATFPHLGFHPILSKVGDPGTGKTEGSRIENRMFGMDWAGIPMPKTTTNNGLDRTCAKQSSQVVFINEAADGKTNFSMDKLLTIFNREGVVKAQKSNDLSTRVVEIKAALAFTWNVEMRASAPIKQRMVSLQYKASDQSDETREAFRRLFERKPEELAAVLQLLMQHRAEIEERLIQDVLQLRRKLLMIGVATERIAGCYAVCLAGFQTLVSIAGIDAQIAKERLKLVLEQTTQMAKTKNAYASDETEDADVFLEAILGELQGKTDPTAYSDDGFRLYTDRSTNQQQ
ncbi:MAG: toprim domain-containing protein, partial [Proteobacteria bacterium]|nr:toprim domain-containing protein [Pseudomonadota bacterium]